MALGKSRLRIYTKGLGTLMAREVEPSSGDFYNLGYLQDMSIADIVEVEEIHNEVGDLVQALAGNRKAGATGNLLQTSKEEIDFIANCMDKVHAVRYAGLTANNVYQYWCWETVRIEPSYDLNYSGGARVLPFKLIAVKQSDLSYDVPVYYLVQLDRELSVDYLKLFLACYDGKNYQNNYTLDYSGYAKHGALSSDYATMWQLSGSLYFIRFDGSNDYVNLGDNFDDDGTSDFMIEAWVRVMGANGGQEEILCKKDTISDNTAGFALYRASSNVVTFKLSSGTASASASSSATVLQNVWTHVAVTVDRNGNSQMYVNGSSSGSATSVASIGSGANALNFYLARESKATSALHGQVDIGAVRVYTYGAGNLPSNISTIISNHYNGEKAKFGL